MARLTNEPTLSCAQEQTARKWRNVTGHDPAYVISHAVVSAEEREANSRCVLNAEPSCDHGVQLHHLIRRACPVDAPTEDVLMVLDADAWPVASLTEHVLPLIDANNGIELVAVRRSVEGMAIWPHPSYAVTTCGHWNRGFHSFSQPPDDKNPAEHTVRLVRSIFEASAGQLCHTHYKLDTGAPLWSKYNDTSNNWIALDRINKLDLDPLFYAVYGLNGMPIAYHQGAGSRHVATSKVSSGVVACRLQEGVGRGLKGSRAAESTHSAHLRIVQWCSATIVAAGSADGD